MKKSSYVPPIIFTNLRIQGHPVEQSIDNLAELELKASQRNVTFQFAALMSLPSTFNMLIVWKDWRKSGMKPATTVRQATSTCRPENTVSRSNPPIATVYGRTTYIPFPYEYSPLSGKLTGHGCSIPCYSSFSRQRLFMCYSTYTACVTG